MEAISVVASVAGVLAFAGQALNGLLKLRGFFIECSGASKSVSRFLKELNTLIETLENVKDILRSLQAVDEARDSIAESILASLQIQLDDCSKEVHEWVNKAADLHPESSSSGTKQTFKKFLVAVKKKDQEDMCLEISKHRLNIATKLSVIGRSLDIAHSSMLRQLSTKIDHFNQNVEAKDQITAQALASLQSSIQGPVFEHRTSEADHHSVESHSASLNSIASQLSRIEQALSGSSYDGEGLRWPSPSPLDMFKYSKTMQHAAADPSPSSEDSWPSLPRQGEPVRTVRVVQSRKRKASGSPDMASKKPKADAHNEDKPHDSTAIEDDIFLDLDFLSSSFTCVEDQVPNTVVVTGLTENLGTAEPFKEYIIARSNLPVPHLISPHRDFLALFLHFTSQEETIKFVQCFNGSWHRSGIMRARQRHPVGSTSLDAQQTNLANPVPRPFYNRVGREVAVYVDRTNLASYCKMIVNDQSKLKPRWTCDVLGCTWRKSFSQPGVMSHLEERHLNHPYVCYQCESSPISEIHYLRFETQLSLKEHITWVHLRKKPLIDQTREGLFATAMGTEVTLATKYVNLAQISMTWKAQYSAIDAIPWAFEELSDAQKCRLQAKCIIDLGYVELELQKIRKECWREGHSLDDIDQYLLNFPTTIPGVTPYLLPAAPSTRSESTDEQNNSENYQKPHTLKAAPLHKSAVEVWATTQDRINFWILRNLQESESDQELHRQYLTESLKAVGASLEDPDAAQWARQVLKYWPLDSAAVGPIEKLLSSNGAVDSRGYMNYARVNSTSGKKAESSSGDKMAVEFTKSI